VPIGWPVQGIYQKFYDGTDINAVDRSNFPFSNISPENYHLLVAGDDYGNLLCFKFPTLQKHSIPVIGNGHSSHVTNVKFNHNDTKIFSTGGEDQCVI